MEVKFYNSMSNQIEVFKPIIPGKVMIYFCGPTVYNYAHIGNMRPVVTFDIMRRMFDYLGYQVTMVSNITDVDDKIIQSALASNKTEKEITDFYEAAYYQCVDSIHAKRPDFIPHATANVPNMIKFIQELVDKGAAYAVDGDVFFSVDKAEDYGKLGNFKIEDLRAGARIEENTKKRNPLDFALWKKTDVGIKWDSPWGAGRPGWHTECVVMINSIFKQPLIDIHGGGFDLKFPHHENEIAQSRACHGTQLANYWIHNGFVNVNNVKMSKSLGNVIRANDALKEYGGNVVRLMLLSAHYRAPLNLSDVVIADAQANNTKFETTLKQVGIKLQLNKIQVPAVGDKQQLDALVASLADDLNVSNALTILYEVFKQLNIESRKNNLQQCAILYRTAYQMFDLLGLVYPEVILSAEDVKLFEQWNAYKSQHDFEHADVIRQQLIKKGLM